MENETRNDVANKLKDDFASLGLDVHNYISFENDVPIVNWDVVLNYKKLGEDADFDVPFPSYFKATFAIERIKGYLTEACILSRNPEGNYAILGENGFDNLKTYYVHQISHPNPTMYDADPYVVDENGELFFSEEINANNYAKYAGGKSVVKIERIL